MPTARPPHRRRALAVAAAAAFLLALLPGTTAAQDAPVSITTPYPAVAVEPGETATFNLTVTAPTPTPVPLEVTGLPDGWTATLRGGGFVVDGVLAQAEAPPALTLDVDVPAEAEEGEYPIAVSAGAVELPLVLRIATAAGGSVGFEAEFATLQGGSDRTFSFTLTLDNDTPAETTFSLSAEGPPGWLVSARPQNEQLATTVTVAGGETATVTVEADPPDDVPAGTYPLLARAEGGGQLVEAQLAVDVTGNFAMTLTTPEEGRLNAEVSAGETTDVALLVVNDGTAPLQGVTLTGTPPEGWEVTFEPEVVESVAPGEVAEVTARLTAAGDALAGDYLVTFSANAGEGEATDDVEIRTTVETSAVFGILGVALIGIAFLVLIAVFRRFGRR